MLTSFVFMEFIVSKYLHKLLASSFTLYLKTLNFHWNIEGSDFFELHELFEQQYLKLALDTDMIAEFIRTLDEKVPAGLNIFAQNSKIVDSDHNLSSNEMVNVLIQDYNQILELIQSALQELPESQLGIAHQLKELYANYQKTIWMLTTWSKCK